MLQKACRKFEFLSNNCSEKRCTSPSYCTGFRKPVESLNSCQTNVRQKSVLLHPIVQAICFRKPDVESLNLCQTIVRQKRRIFPYYCTDNLLQKAFGSKQFVKYLTARIKNFVGHFTANKSAKTYTNCRHFFTVFVT
jgi:ribosomal protein S15P/S13E